MPFKVKLMSRGPSRLNIKPRSLSLGRVMVSDMKKMSPLFHKLEKNRMPTRYQILPWLKANYSEGLLATYARRYRSSAKLTDDFCPTDLWSFPSPCLNLLDYTVQGILEHPHH